MVIMNESMDVTDKPKIERTIPVLYPGIVCRGSEIEGKGFKRGVCIWVCLWHTLP